jgi:hypothetical protein
MNETREKALADETVANLALALGQFAEAVGPILEATAGYRANCLTAGFSETAAEVMAMDFHRMLFAGLINGMANQS